MVAVAQTLGPSPHGEMPAAIENFAVGENVYVRAFAVDRGRNALWVGTSVGALEIDLATRQVRSTFTRKEGLANEYVFAIGVAPDRTVWFGTNAGGTSTYRDGIWKTFFPMHGLADYWVYAFAFDHAGDVWIGTWDGANHFNAKTGTFKTFRQELVNIWVYGIDIDRQGRIWFGTEGGVSMFDGERWRAWTHDDGLGAANVGQLPASANTGLGTRLRHDLNILAGTSDTYNPNYIFAVHVDRRDDTVWFGTWGGGASRFDTKQAWKSYTDRDGLAGNVVYSIAQEADGTLWFGTNRGISRFDGSRWINYGTRAGLIGDHVYAIAIPGDGSIWAASKGGASRLTYRR